MGAPESVKVSPTHTIFTKRSRLTDGISSREHIKRNHYYLCTRCGKIFPKHYKLSKHQQLEPPCPIAPYELPEVINEKQSAEIARRQTVNWNEIYSIIFPGEHVPSPCKSIPHEPPYNQG